MADRPQIFDAAALEDVRKASRADPEQVRRLRNALFKECRPDHEVRERSPLAEAFELHCLRVASRHDSTTDGATKLLFETASGLLTESVVLRIATGRTTLCVSSQVGCAAACRFCATGTMGIARSLETSEILDQVLQAGQLLRGEQRQLRNVVFMGMGEPFHNEDNVVNAIARLTDPAWFNLSPKKILVSSVGIIPAMLRFARRFPDVGLALSLHSVRPSVRQQLIPVAKKYPLPELRAALVELMRIQDRPVMLEYLMLDGLTDTDDDLRELLSWTEDLHVHINLIPFNAVDGVDELRGSSRSVCVAFAQRLKDAGRTTTLRHSLGRDIEAACGQLVKRENLARARAGGSTGSADGRP